MIDKRELLDTATEMSLRPDVVEKDYVLGWMLAGISAHPKINETWIFKGGTCLKKCYFETYRFSEDLDFTLTDPAQIDEDFLKEVFTEVGNWVYEQSGIEVPADRQKFTIYKNPRGNPSCQGKISYRGPISPRDMPRIKLDLTADECLVLPPVQTPVYHPYSDIPDEGISVSSYAYEEVFGEKVRALGERTRPRDLYDVINLYRNQTARPSPVVLLDVLKQKCDFKGIEIPSLPDLEPHQPDLTAAWEHMLAHQLPVLPPYESFWEGLPEFFDWLNGRPSPEIPAAFALSGGETVLRDRRLRLPVGEQTRSILEIIRFAASNRMLVELQYQGSTRLIEPYSLRRTKAGDVILHANRAEDGGHRSYRIDRMEGARVTNQTFTPRYEIELTPTGPVPIPPTPRTAVGRTPSRSPFRTPRTRTPRRQKSSFGQKPVHIFQCPICEKKFRRSRFDGQLNPHKNKEGFACPGRMGIFLETKY